MAHVMELDFLHLGIIYVLVRRSRHTPIDVKPEDDLPRFAKRHHL